MSYCRTLLQTITIALAVFHSASAEAQSLRPQEQSAQSQSADDNQDRGPYLGALIFLNRI